MLAWILKLLTVLGLGTLKMAWAIPAGLALGLPPLVVGVTTALGGIVGMAVVLTVGHGLRRWLLRRWDRDPATARPSAIFRIWERYGVIGLGLLGPLLVSPPGSAALGVALGAPRKRLLFWLSVGVSLWSTVLTALAALGWAGIRHWWG